MKKLRSFKEKLIWVEGLLIDCPFGKPLSECPAAKLRELPFEERMVIASRFTENDLDEIIEHHVKCINDREHPNPRPNH